ncbi:MAG: PQQ-binding-like beta-propeller repeat protein [Anaerolineae bacterium]|jgi:WD40 repeat protein|nr:PQQ-binding-like beta-propeller repeat protein [Anaerolineae bacterium]MBT7069793.1 PQQ-binding-like beta-propeller repeat protein [Anaerolineae bacterium]MBT7326715.1 PQQ-binding-like beta-propeller repeat protein [Anaerolineae bacterium]MBT7601356.1 PQQ-binding-like beta-propeller repeat protein [Anaerolineae bacterium]
MRKIVFFFIFLVVLAACSSPTESSEIRVAPAQDTPAAPSYPVATLALPTPIPPSVFPPDVASIEILKQFGIGIISQIAWSPDGKFIVASGSAGIHFHDAETLQQIRFIPTNYLITSIAFSPDGKYLVTGSADIVFSRRAYWRRFSPWGSENNFVQLWDVESGALLATLKGGNSYLTTVIFSPDGTFFASGSNYSDDNAIRIWELASVMEGDSTLWKIYRKHTRGVFQIDFSPDGKTLLSGSGDNSARLWDIYEQENNNILMYRSAAKVKVFAVSYNPVVREDGTELVALAGADFFHNTPTELLEIWDANSGELILELSGHESSLDSVQFSPDGQILASGGSYPDNTIHLWDVESGKILHSLYGHHSGVRSLVFSPDGKTLTSSGWDGLLHLWDVETGELKETNAEYTSVIHSAAFNPRENILATGGDEGFIRLWNVESGEKLKILNTESSRVTSLAFAGTHLIAGTDEPDFDIQVWDIETGERIQTFIGHESFSQVIALSPSEDIFASGGSLGDNTLYVWSMEAGQEFLYSIDGHTRSVKSVAFRHDGKLIASGDGKGTLHLINAATGETQHTIQAHSCAVTALFFSEIKRELISGDCGGNIHFWNSESGELLREISTKNIEISQIELIGEELLVGYQDGSIWFWNLERSEVTLKAENISGTSLPFSAEGKQLILPMSDDGGRINLWKIEY